MGERVKGGDRGRLCVGMVVGGDFAGVWATVQAVRLYQEEVAGAIEFVIVDGRPVEADADEVRGLVAVPGVRYVPVGKGRETLGEVLFREAEAELVCEIGSGVMLPPGMLAALLAWFDGHAERGVVVRGMTQGDGLGGDGGEFRFVTSNSTSIDTWAGLAAGPSGEAYSRAELVAYRRADWPDIRASVGGADGVAIAGLDGARERMWRWGDPEARNPFDFFPAIFCLNMDNQPERWREMQGRFRTFGIEGRVERFPAVATPGNHHHGCTLSWRAMVAEAQRRDYEYVLIFEDDAVFLDTTMPVLRTAIAEVGKREWDLFFLGAVVWSQVFPLVSGCTALQECGPVTASPACAVHRRAYARILADIPTGGAAFEDWMLEWLAIDQYLSRRIAEGTFRALITTPRVATQPVLRYYADADLALGDRYVI